MASANYVAKPPKSWVIPVTRGCDRAFTLRRRDPAGELADWNASVYMEIDIDKADPTSVEAVVEGSLASFLIDSAVCDQVRNATRWRIVMSEGELETALAVGNFERHDG